MNKPSGRLLFLPLMLSTVSTLAADCVCGIVIDTSGSMRPAIDQAILAAQHLVKRAGTADRFFVLRFSDEITLEQQSTDQKQRLLQAFDNLVVSGHPSKVLDAIFLAGQEMRRSPQPAGCRALVLITDGDEQASYYKTTEVLQTLREQRLSVFVIGFPQIIPKQKGKKAQKQAADLLDRLANSTGGGAWFPHTDTEVTTAVEEILKRLGE